MAKRHKNLIWLDTKKNEIALDLFMALGQLYCWRYTVVD
jgi:hypothetical protein